MPVGFELLAHHYGRQSELLPESCLVDPDIGEFLTTLLSHQSHSQSCLSSPLH